MRKIKTQTCRSKIGEEFVRHEYPKVEEVELNEDVNLINKDINLRCHPFDINSNLQHFIFAEGYTYLMSKEQTENDAEINKVIPKAYLPYTILKRGFFIYKGEIAWKLNEIKETDKYIILGIDKVKISNLNYSHKCPSVNNLEKDIENIKKVSKKIDNIFMFAILE